MMVRPSVGMFGKRLLKSRVRFLLTESIPQKPSSCFRFCSTGPDRIVPAASLISWDVRTPVNLRLDPTKPPDNYPPVSVPTMMRETVKQSPDQLALAVKRSGQWVKWTYREYYRDVKAAAKGFIELGLEPLHAVGIMGHNAPEFHMSSLGAVFARGLSCGIYTTNTPDMVAYICRHAPTDILVLENETLLLQLTHGRPVRTAFPSVKKVVLWDPDTPDTLPDDVVTWQELIRMGSAVDDDKMVDRQKDMAVNEPCMILYTSGTTGLPKGALLSHDNVTWGARISMEHYGWKYGEEVLLSYLPLSHAAALLIDCYMILYRAGTVYFADKDVLKGTLVENLKEVQPTKFWGVPRVWEKIEDRMKEVSAQQSSPLKRTVAQWAKQTSLDYHQGKREGKSKNSFKFNIAKKLVLSRVHEALGLQRAVSCNGQSLCSTSAPLSDQTYFYFESLGMPMVELYGMTESSGPTTTNLEGPGTKPGTVGRIFRGVPIRLEDPDESGAGEVAVWGRNVIMGYSKDEEKTRQGFTEDFWYKSGDIGRVDEDGFLTITSRIKELVITSGGENISPVPIEDRIKQELSEIISHAVVVGDKRKFLSCLMTLKVEVDPSSGLPTDQLDSAAVAWCEKAAQGCKVRSVEDFIKGPNELREEIQKALDRVNEKAISRPQRIQKFALLSKEFSIPSGELGPTLKLKRFFVLEKYKGIIDKLYVES